MKAVLSLALVTAIAARAQGTQPKASSADYAAHARLEGMPVGAECLFHSAPGPEGAIFVKDYLVIEVAVFPPAAPAPVLGSAQFRLRLNGKRDLLFAQSPGMVAASLRYPGYEGATVLTAGAGIGDGSVVVGGPPRAERFPGDPRPGLGRLPRTPRVESGNPEAASKPAQTPEEFINRIAFPEGSPHGPASGCLFFHYQGKLKRIRSLELVVTSGKETATLKLL